ncbi:MAG: methionyl-tRNA formyltransferase [Planctomycetes bacterium]|nr:methionyl-tRNA formyltransferase [Planctomycetota bacterium]
MRVVFFGSPPFAVPVFERLAASAHRVLALVTLPDKPQGRGQRVAESPLVAAAAARGIEVLQPANPHDEAFLARLRELAPDVLVVASYGVIMKSVLLELAPHGALNVHASLLPRHRGASPIQASIAHGDAETGVAIQKMVLALDEGDVLVERRTAIGAHETAGELGARLAILGGEALIETLDALAAGRARATPQDSSRATYTRKIKKTHGRVDWTRAADELERQVRALNPWPLARTLDPKGRELAILRARAVDGAGAPGEILAADAKLVVACGRGALEIQELVPAGKRALAAEEFLRGARLERGGRMTSPENATR